MFDKNFIVKSPLRENWIVDRIHFANDTLVYYTDGSKTNEGVGAGVYGVRNNSYSLNLKSQAQFFKQKYTQSNCASEKLIKRTMKTEAFIFYVTVKQNSQEKAQHKPVYTRHLSVYYH